LQEIVFGQNPNQTRHAFRYTDIRGLDRDIVIEAVLADLRSNLPLRTSPPRNAPFVGTVSLNGVKLRYHAYAVSEELVNVGRIVAP
jgi:hypothetical protein